ncbi:MAG: helix-turn-helix transcriptional regulator [Thermus sp.]|uniref:helix-turn-helix transcriptional regulator n=1 Tax=Thermus sp. TaxID=275 RepID=UPI003919A92B
MAAKDLATLIRVKRAEKRWSQADLAVRAGVSRSLVAYVETGGRPSISTLKKMATALGISASELSAILLAEEAPHA